MHRKVVDIVLISAIVGIVVAAVRAVQSMPVDVARALGAGLTGPAGTN